ncbi:signal transduction histidine kinase [Duganella sp. 1411]|uniref:sensor histidine kinase n=1 Tax=Duganella sp. 1411 TaxID=2806572 RepID=UPI001AE923B9|nr:sensor histidine kinase [Duganella sp. 1411]MBP1205740.1 signal transduction histidine kinase [Duganella sp. 1411]
MSISNFIRDNMRAILTEWTTFAAKTAPPDGEMTKLALTDHAEQILNAIALDIETHQSQQEQYEKSQGDEVDLDAEESAAAIHGRLRHASNFSLLQLSSEFRALRATVLRLWLPQVSRMSDDTINQMVRFNEAIDQALAESIVTYSERDDRTRDLFLAVLGHDLRAPLATVSLVGDLLGRPQTPPEQIPALAERTKRSAMLMSAMVTDLLGFARLQMGAGMPTVRAMLEAAEVCKTAVADAQAMYPNASVVFRAEGDLRGEFDNVRLLQLVTNLLINAAQHSDKGTPVTLVAKDDGDAITLTVSNVGPVIPAESLRSIFQPLVQLEPEAGHDARPKTSLGLGLFIAQAITKEHDGTIGVTSSETGGTVFTARLPRAHCHAP